jgi:hypothetical protein
MSYEKQKSLMEMALKGKGDDKTKSNAAKELNKMKVFLNNIQELKRVCEKGEDTLGHVRL